MKILKEFSYENEKRKYSKNLKRRELIICICMSDVPENALLEYVTVFLDIQRKCNVLFSFVCYFEPLKIKTLRYKFVPGNNVVI